MSFNFYYYDNYPFREVGPPNYEDYTQNYWIGCSCVCVGLLCVHMLGYKIMEKCGKIRPYSSITPNNNLDIKIVDSDWEEIEKFEEATSLVTIKYKLLELDRPLALDMYHWLCILLFCICIWSKGQFLLIVASLLVVYDILYFAYVIYVRRHGGEDHKSKIRIIFVLLAGFPFGSMGKILTGLWYDEYLSLGDAYYPYVLIFSIISYLTGIVASIIGGICVLVCCCSKGAVDAKSMGIALLIAGGLILISGLCVGFFAGFENIIYLGSSEKLDIRGFFKTNPDQSFPAWTRTFAVIWVPMGLLFEISFWNAVKKGTFYYFLPDYITNWAVLISSQMLVYHLENKEKTDFIHILPLPMLLSVLGGIIYHTIDLKRYFKSPRHKAVRLYRITGENRMDIESVMRQLWNREEAGIGRDCKDLDYNDFRVTDVFQLDNICLKDRYDHKKEYLRHKYRHGPPMKIQHQKPNGNMTPNPVKTTSLHSQALDSLRDDEINEYFLFHGTGNEDAKNGICRNGFLLRKCSELSLYGKGIYLAEDSVKSDQYAGGSYKNCYMFLVRACLGRTYINTVREEKFTAPPCQRIWCMKKDCQVHRRTFDSVLSDVRNFRFREYIIFDESMCYPQYLIVYNRTTTLHSLAGEEEWSISSNEY